MAFPDDPLAPGIRIQLSPTDTRRVKRASAFAFTIVALLAVLLGTIGPYTEWLWFSQDVRVPQVYLKAYEARGALFALAFFPAWAVLHFTIRRALTLSPIYSGVPVDVGTVVATRVLNWIQERGPRSVSWVAPLLATLTALNFSANWNVWLVARNAVPFGVKDPMFGLDVSFFVFQLPWWLAIAGALVGLLFLTTLITVGIYGAVQSVATVAKVEFNRPQIRSHISWVVGAFALSLGVWIWLQTYDAGLVVGAQFTGAGFAASQTVGLTRGLAILLGVVGLLTWVAERRFAPYRVPIWGAGLAVAYSLVALVIWPSLVQRVVVSPQVTEKESPYAARAIKMTRFAYGLDALETRNFSVKDAPSAAQVARSGATLENIRLWDPDVLLDSFESQQGLRRYYAFNDVDVDRYPINGNQTMVMLAPREINPSGLDASARNWNTVRLRYTHGYGVAVAQVNASSADGQPSYLAKDIPVQAKAPFELKQPQIYFGDMPPDYGESPDDYAIVNTREAEISFQTTEGTTTHRWSGGRGIPTGDLLTRMAFSFRFGDGNLLVTSNITPQSRLLFRRNVRERAARVFPFLRFDSDPYIVAYEGRLVWIADGYTMTDRVPYSAVMGGQLNYIRNSVKIVVDAYTGETTGYAVEPDEPILRVYRRIYPGLVKDISELPKNLERHFRYAEDMLGIQARILSTYHVTDPSSFLGNVDAWEVASQRGTSGGKETMRPYYVQMQLPDEPTKGFIQILPFTARQKPNMTGWLAAHCDPAHYGRLTLYRFNVDSPPPGPELMESNFNSNPDIANINRTFNNDQSEIIVGNLFVVPIGESVMYVEPLFLRSKTAGLSTAPRLFRVILATKDRIVVGDTYADALQKLFGASGARETSTKPKDDGSAVPEIAAASPTAAAALKTLREADEALRGGDFARYGELQKRLRSQLEELAKGTAPAGP